MSPTKLLVSTTLPGLFEPSHTTLKSVIPRRPCTSLKKGSTILTNCDRVNSSLNSNNIDLAALEIAFSKTINNLRTLIWSNADGAVCIVLSPNKTTPEPV